MFTIILGGLTMTDKKLTDNEIIKALECCATNVAFGNCAYCPYKEYWAKGLTCVCKATKDSLDLINRQKAEIERLSEENDILNGVIDRLVKESEGKKV